MMKGLRVPEEAVLVFYIFGEVFEDRPTLHYA
jgi:hypothetical protein